MIVMKESATAEQVEAVVRQVEHVGAKAHISRGELHTVIGAIGDRDHVANLELDGFPGDRVGDQLNPFIWEVQEFILINGVGVRPEECIEPIGFSLTNLAGDARHAQVVAELRALLKGGWRACLPLQR